MIKTRAAVIGSARTTGVEVAHVSVPRTGEWANGDRAVFRALSGQLTLFAVVDALGHGVGADEVAAIAVEQLSLISLDEPIRDVMERLHRQLRGTRGAAATVCLVAGRKIQACAVGNVELRCTETQIPFIFSPGILGLRVQKFRVCEALLKAASRLVMFSDGISTRLRLDAVRQLSPEVACNGIMERHRRPEDDATVLIADLE